MFKTKLVSSNVTIMLKLPKFDNVLVNVIASVTIHSQ
jgi:hypothetical protein